MASTPPVCHHRKMPILTVNGVDLEYGEAGQGRPMILVHGSAADRTVWNDVLSALAPSHRVISYSRRYHRPNKRIESGQDYSMQEHVEDLLALIDHFELDTPTVIGHSYGGFVALLAAMSHPDLFGRMVLIEPPVIPLLIDDPPRPSQLLRLLIKSPSDALTVIRFGITTVKPAQRAAGQGDLETAVQIFGRGVLGRDRFERLTDEEWAMILDNYTLAEFTGSGFPPLNHEEVAGVRTPTMILNGAESVPLFHVLSDALSELLPDVSRTEVAGASHNMPADTPHLLAQHVLEFTSAV